MSLYGDHEYANTRRVCYPEEDGGEGGATFIPICPICGRYVKANPTIRYNDFGLVDEPNGVCKIHGPIKMLFEGFL